jgi:RNA polymerase sigma factor (sigma-70 family)
VAPTDNQLLRQHLSDPSGKALGIIIQRHLPLVHSVARRVTANDEAARDISQIVFLRLVKKASKIPRSLPLTAWFHRETHSASVDYVRSEIRRQKREQTAASLDAMNATSEPWHQIAPQIDGAINELSKNDRALVLLRFYQNKTHPQIAEELGIKEDAARMRTNRALEKLRSILGKRGITTTALLASTLPSNAVSPAPASLAASITATLQVATAATGALVFLKSHLLTFAALAIGAAAVTTQQIKISQLEKSQNSSPSISSQPKTNSVSTRDSAPYSKRSITNTEPDLLAIFANPNPAERLRLLQDYSLQLPTDRIPETLGILRRKTPEWDNESKMLAHLLLTRWTKAEPEAAFASLDNEIFSFKRGHTTSVLSTLASLDPQRTANWLTSPTNSLAFYPIVGHILAGTIAKEWSRQDPVAALVWAKTLAEQQQAGAYSGALSTIASSDPRQAATLALTVNPGPARDHVLDEIARSWAGTSPQEVLTWAAQLDHNERSKTIAAALDTWTEIEPTRAAQYLDQNPSIGHLELVAERWSRRDPAAAAEWVAPKDRSPHRDSALGKVLWNWTTQDPTSATAWVDQQPQGTSRDHAIAGLATAALEFDPPIALEWAQKISNSKIRDELIAHQLATWTHRDPTNAQSWRRDNKFNLNK